MLIIRILSALGRCSILISVLLCSVISASAQSDVDANTLLLLRFENTLNGEQGETPVNNVGVSFESGILGQGVLVEGSDLLQYATAQNFNMPAGTIEFWMKPRWTGLDHQNHVFFSLGFGPNSDFVLLKDGAANFRFIIDADDSEADHFSFEFWNPNRWLHIAVTWTVPGRMITYVNGIERINHASTSHDVLSSIPSALNIGSRSVLNNAQGNCVIDELRVSNIARTPAEINARFLAAQTIQSLSINPVTRNLWKTWRIPLTIRAVTNMGTVNVPGSPATVSSSDPSVLMVTTDGKIVGVGPGTALLTATFNGIQAKLSVNVHAPLLEPRIQTISNYLATPAEGALFEMPVVILRYLPTADGRNLDVAWAPDFFFLNPIPLVQLEQNLDLYDHIVKFMLEEGSRFRGYGSQAPPPSLGYRVVAIITVYEPPPPGRPNDPAAALPLYDAEWFQIFERFGMRDYVNKLGVKEVWMYWGGVQPNIPSYDPAIHPPENMREGWESNMSSPTTGDISNSNRNNTDLPIYDRSYIVYKRNIRRLDPGTIHPDGHQLEQMFDTVNRRQTGDTQLFWQKFVGASTTQWQRGRSGDTHHPPNAVTDYDYQNFAPFDSDIMDWKPDGGQTTPFSAATYGDVPYKFPNNYLQAFGSSAIEPNWYIFWRQSLPGYNNTIPFGTNRMTNWWQFIGDWDAAIRAGLGLYEPASCTFSLPVRSQSFSQSGGTGVANVNTGSACRWIASSNAPWIKLTSGDTSNNGNAVVNFSVEPNPHGYPRNGTIVIANQLFVVSQSAPNPALLNVESSTAAVALNSVTFLRDPFSLRTIPNFSLDQRTRISLFALNVELLPSENISIVSAQVEDSQHRIFSLPVEFVGKVPNFDWLTQINLRLPDELSAGGDMSVKITVRGLASNEAKIRISPNQF